MIKSKLSKIYVIIEAFLLMALMILQIFLIAEGRYVSDKTASLWPYIGALKITLTSISLLMVILAFFLKRKEKKTTMDLLLIYFSLTVVADIFFSFSDIAWIPHLCFLLTYFLFVFIRRGKWFEIIIAIGIGLVAFFILHFALKMELVLALIDSILGATLVLNCGACYYKYAKTKDKFYLIFAIGVTLILLGDLTIVGTAKIKNPMALNNFISMLNWPLYVGGNVTIVSHYLYRKGV
ncbi:MAG: hypothetical protein K5694_01125 [Bacilli bacterium]|nr:hypothetical protein [Bacilli bacterium]